MKASVLLFVVLVFHLCVTTAFSQMLSSRGNGNQRRGGLRKKAFQRLRGNLANSPPFLSGGRGRFADRFSSLRQRLSQRSRGSGRDGIFNPSSSVFQASASVWNRTLEGGVRVLEKGVFQNTSILSVLRVVSRDRALTSAGYLGAATLYVFGEQDTATVVAKPGFLAKRKVPACFLLPDRNITYSQAVEEASSRNNTDVPGAPATVEKLNGTAEPLELMERLQVYGENPAILVFCGFSNLVRVVPADDAAFPAASGTETEQVLRVITLDRELQILAPRETRRSPYRGGPARFPGSPFFPRQRRGHSSS